MTYAKVIADSVTEHGHRLTTMEVRFHRFVLAEFNTHRVFSRNSASSRAIPVTKQLDSVLMNPAFPVSWPAEQPGMRGGDEIVDSLRAATVWQEAADDALKHARNLTILGVHKSVVNRLLEPFMWHTVIVSSTAWKNFFDQRVSDLAQPEIRLAAEKMQVEYDKSWPTLVDGDGYHLPYIRDEDWEDVESRGVPAKESLEGMIKVSVARCARVSYLTHDGRRDLNEDIRLYEKLTSARPIHASPLEHVASPASWNAVERLSGVRPKVGNFIGWVQHRYVVEEQLDTDSYH